MAEGYSAFDSGKGRDQLATEITEVQNWLKSIFGAANREVPEFERTPFVIKYFHRIAKLSESGSKVAEIVARDMREKAVEYRREAARITEIMDAVGISRGHLSPNAITSANIIGHAANSINIRDCEKSSLLLGMAELSLRKSQVEEHRTAVQKESDMLFENIRKSIIVLTHLKRTLTEIEQESPYIEAEMKRMRDNMTLMEAKRRQYAIQLLNFLTLLRRSKYSPEINHGELMLLNERRKDLEKRIKPLLHALTIYQGLPPDKTLAELITEEKKNECEAAEKHLEDLLHSACYS